MKNWVDFVCEHHNIIKLSDEQVKIPNIAYDSNGRWFDHVITKHEGHYTIDELDHDTGETVATWNESSIKEYLGY